MSVAMRGLLLHPQAQGLWEVGLIKVSEKWEAGRGDSHLPRPLSFLPCTQVWACDPQDSVNGG